MAGFVLYFSHGGSIAHTTSRLYTTPRSQVFCHYKLKYSTLVTPLNNSHQPTSPTSIQSPIFEYFINCSHCSRHAQRVDHEPWGERFNLQLFHMVHSKLHGSRWLHWRSRQFGLTWTRHQWLLRSFVGWSALWTHKGTSTNSCVISTSMNDWQLTACEVQSLPETVNIYNIIILKYCNIIPTPSKIRNFKQSSKCLLIIRPLRALSRSCNLLQSMS